MSYIFKKKNLQKILHCTLLTECQMNINSFKVLFLHSKLKCKCSRLFTLCIEVFLCRHKLLHNIPFGQHRVAWCIHILEFVYKIHDMADSTTVFVLDIECLHSCFHRRCWNPGNSNYCGLG